MRHALTQLGKHTLAAIEAVGETMLLLLAALRHVFPWGRRGLRMREALFQMARLGVESIPLVALVNFLVGAIIAISLSDMLRDLGVLQWISMVVGVAVTRELGPLMTALTMSGLAGAAIAAEIGTMSVSEELVALRAQALSPIYFLVAPRLAAMLVMMPCLVIIANAVGVFGGFVVSVLVLGIDPVNFYHLAISSMTNEDLIRGVFWKAWVFGAIITVVACYMGLNTQGGADGVGRTTTQSVVWAIVLIIFSNLLMTALFNHVLS